MLLAKIALVVSLAFGSTGGALAVAANSLPDSPLYPAKLGMEEVRLNLAAGPADQAALQLSLAQTRAQEMEQVAQTGGIPDEATLTRLQTHLNAGLSLTAQLPDRDMQRLLTQAQQMIRDQEQTMVQAQVGASGPALEPLQQASRYLNQTGQDVTAGLQDPQTFRWQHGEKRPSDVTPQPTPSPAPDPTGTPIPATPCPNGDCQPVGDQHRYGPQADQPGPGAPGGNPDGTCADCQPAGDQHRYGPQSTPSPVPDATGTPGLATPCPDGNCQPAGDQNQYGPQPEQPGPGAPGGNTDSTCANCQPAGDQNQYGSQPNQQSSSSNSRRQSGGNGGGQGGGRH